MFTCHIRRKALVLVTALIALAPAACYTGFSLGPPAEAVLAGSWKVTVSGNPDLNETLVFDSSGKLAERRIKVGSTTVSQTDVHRSTSVTGDSVRIQTAGDTLFGGDNVFEGTFNADKTIITGTLSTVVSAGSTTVTTEMGDAVLTRQ